MSDQQNIFEIRLARLPLFLLLIVGLCFFYVGLDLTVLHNLFTDFIVAPDNRIKFYLFLFIAFGVGGLIAVQMLLYLIIPPVLFRASAEGIAFATGLRYTLYTIPWKYVESIGGGIDVAALAAEKKIFGGLQIKFKESPEIPGILATSIGARYVYYILTLSYWYMNTSIKNAIIKTTQLKNRFGDIR